MRQFGASFERIAREVWRQAVALASRAVNSVRHNLGLGLLALGLSASLWALITIERNPPRTDSFGRLIPVQVVNLADDLAVLGEIDPVEVRITAPLDSWDRLREDNFKATVDLSQAQAGEQKVSVQVRCTDRQVRVLSVHPSTVSVSLDAVMDQVVPVKVNVQNAPAFGYSSDAARPQLEQVTVSGPESLVTSVDHASAYVDIEGARVTVRQTFLLSPRTGRGYEVVGVTLDPSSVLVEIPIKQETRYQSFVVSPELSGTVAYGYWVGGISVEPASVTVVGPLEAFVAIDYLRTEPVDINGATDSVTRQVGLALPEGMSLVSPQRVTVQIAITPLKGTQILRIAPQIKNAPSGRKVLLDTDAVEVTVGGELAALKELTPADISITLDLTNLRPGSYSLKPEVKVAKKGVEVLRSEPSNVGVTIQ